MSDQAQAPSEFADLAAARVGGKALAANDEFFAPKENLLKPESAVFIADKFTSRGKWMDGWETRRRRTPGFDWCVVKLGLRGIIHDVDVDTSHFTGNYPQYCSLEACDKPGVAFPSLKSLTDGQIAWTEILSKSALKGGGSNPLFISDPRPWTHVRLNIFPDGGVARLRVHGTVLPDWEKLVKSGKLVDLAAIENGGLVVTGSDMFFGHKNNLIMPGRSKNMGDGWETKRRRGPGHDWVILKLGAPGDIQKIEVDTNHFKGNYPDTCSLEGCLAPEAAHDALNSEVSQIQWTKILPQTKLHAHKRHFFEKELLTKKILTHVRFHIYPDGGVSRLRLYGKPAKP